MIYDGGVSKLTCCVSLMTQLLMNAIGPLHHTNTILLQNTQFSPSNQFSIDKAESCSVFSH